MHNSYFLLRQLGLRLNQILIGTKLHCCFSQEKDELVLHFTGTEREHFLHVIMLPDFSMIRLAGKFSRARKNSITLFQQIGQPLVQDVRCFENERCLLVALESGWSMLIKMFGNQSNIILCQKERPYDLFKKKLTSDLNLSIDKLSRKFNVNRNELEKQQGDFRRMLPTLGGAISRQITQYGYELLESNEQWELIRRVLDNLNEPEYYIYYKQGTPLLTMFQPPNYFFHEFDVIEALDKFYFEFVRARQLNAERKSLLRALQKRRKRAEVSIEKSENRLNQIKTQTGHRKIADIIMANLHVIPSGASQVELPEFYTENRLLIKLKPSLTPQKNAEQYYRKSKNQNKEIQVLKQNRGKSEQELKLVNEHIKFIDNCGDLKDLRNYVKDHNLKVTKEKSGAKHLFKEFVFQDFLILVGRNAVNNDLLTQKFANKDDLWLHAKDVKGSHVVVKQIPGKNFPATVIEKAAQLAAFYSKRKNDSLCPVAYTPKKYVRKSKGAPAGQVVVEREKVLLVVPEDLVTPQ